MSRLGLLALPRGDLAAAVAANVPPVADFAYTIGAAGLVSFFDASTDVDGSITLRDWDWGDGSAHGTTTNPTHTYGTLGVFLVTLTVTDNSGATHAVSRWVDLRANILRRGNRPRKAFR